jgi:hypothetical protein
MAVQGWSCTTRRTCMARTQRPLGVIGGGRGRCELGPLFARHRISVNLFGLCWNPSESAELGEPNRYFVVPTWTQRTNRFARRAESGERFLILPPAWSPKIVREKSDFARRFKADLAVQPSAQKYFFFRFTEICDLVPSSRLYGRGRFGQSSPNVRRGAMDVGVSPDERCRHGRRRRVVLASRR